MAVDVGFGSGSSSTFGTMLRASARRIDMMADGTRRSTAATVLQLV
jgi:hypothetical protein